MESNIKGLVAAGHEMASELKAECGAVDMRSVAKLLSDLATQLEVQLARANALAAENAGLKSGAMGEIEVINRGGQAYCVKDGVQVNPMYARGWNDYRAKSLQSDTPATDAFLAEVRASELDSLAGVAETMLVKLSNQQCSSDMREVVGWKMVLQQANNLASQLRKGGNQ
ncbi:hypothetical protein FQF50_05385 [Escherichia coli]|nr:hypothetical protein [Escherichia coli]EII4835075.1 hypothetical protein [Escherichia coli]